MKYLLFTFRTYYPSGGWNDYRNSYDSHDAALEAAANTPCDHWQIVCDGEIVAQGERL